MLAPFFRASQQVTSEMALPVGEMQWEALIEAAAAELLLPAVAQQLRAVGLPGSVPGHISECLNEAEECNGERNRQILKEAVYAAKVLNQIGIKPVALKGVAYLIAGVYPNISCRYIADIDLLVPKADVARTVEQLREHGYRSNENDVLGQLRHHYPGMNRPGLPEIEIHERIGLGICERMLPADAIMAEARPVTIDGATFLIPSPTQPVSHLIIHSQLAHPYSQRIFPPLRAQYDLWLMHARFGQQIDWLVLEKTYRRLGESSTLCLHLLEVHRNINLPLPKIPTISDSGSPRGLLMQLRWARRVLLNRHPWVRNVDPVYIAMSLLSRRLRLIPSIISEPRALLPLLRRITRFDFYVNLFSDFH